jgi:hypothetical protein
MKIKHYNDAIDWLTRPKFNGGGSVKNKEVLPKRKPEEELKKRKKKRFEKLKEYLENPEEVEEMLELQEGGRIGFANGDRVSFDEILKFMRENPNMSYKDVAENFKGKVGRSGASIKARNIATRIKELGLSGQFGERTKPRTVKELTEEAVKTSRGQGILEEFKKTGDLFKFRKRMQPIYDLKDPEYRKILLERQREYRKTDKGKAAMQRSVEKRKEKIFLESSKKGVFYIGDSPKDRVFRSLYRSSQQPGSRWQLKSKVPERWTRKNSPKAKFFDTKTKKTITFNNLQKYLDETIGKGTYKKALKPYEAKEALEKFLVKYRGDEVALGKLLKEKRFTPEEFKRYRAGLTSFNVNHPEKVKNNWWTGEVTYRDSNLNLQKLEKRFESDLKLADGDKAKRKVIVDKFSKDIKKLGPITTVTEAGKFGTKPTTANVMEAMIKDFKQRGIKDKALTRAMRKVGVENVTQLNFKIPIISTMYDVAKSIPGDVDKAKYLSAGFKTLGLAVAPYVAYKTFQDVAAGKNLVEALERNLIGTDIIGGTKDILAMTPEEREARAKVKQEQIAELNIDMPTGFGFIEAPPVQTDMALEEAKQKLDAAKRRVAQERAEDEAGVAAMRKQAFDNLKDTVTGKRFTDRPTAMNLAGGGLLKQAGKRSGPPPEKGPGGLASLEDYARTMME